MFKNILLAVDLAHKDKHSEAIETASKLVSNGSKLFVISVVPPLDGGGFISSYLPQNFGDKIIEEAKLELHKFTDEYLPNIKEIKHLVVHGKIYEKISEAADQLDIDLIITLASSPKDRRSPSFGPNVARISRNSHCSVLVIR